LASCSEADGAQSAIVEPHCGMVELHRAEPKATPRDDGTPAVASVTVPQIASHALDGQ
jgi:hypothetical protein